LKEFHMSRLNNKIALVTGGTSGIGLATVQRFLEEGATVIATGSRPESVAAAKAQAPGATFVVSDAGDPVSIGALIGDVLGRHKRLDVLFLNAGIAKFAPWDQTPDALFDTTMNVNLRGPWLTLKAAWDHLAPGASVIFTTSVVNVTGMANASAYAASKAGLRVLARVAASELAPRKIRVNAIAPGPIETPIFDKTGFPKEALDEMAAAMVADIPLARFGQPVEVANAAVFLASDESSYITGAELPVDGGYTQT
jgi:NAD(P)-dependent dehydrogenase (short-subunit alcohol dehydrogenase family)